jgi:hypothetical protein
VRYFGAYASASKHRRLVVPPPPLDLALSPALLFAASPPATPIKIPRRTPWLTLLAKVYGTDSTRCLFCKIGRFRVVAAITDPAAIRKILDHVEGASDRAAFAKHDPTLPAP